MIMAICMVNGIRLQNPSPKNLTKSLAAAPVNKPAQNTRMTAPRANTNASGNHRCDQSASAIPRRANWFREASSLATASLPSGFGAIGPPLATGLDLRWAELLTPFCRADYTLLTWLEQT